MIHSDKQYLLKNATAKKIHDLNNIQRQNSMWKGTIRFLPVLLLLPFLFQVRQAQLSHDDHFIPLFLPMPYKTCC